MTSRNESEKPATTAGELRERLRTGSQVAESVESEPETAEIEAESVESETETAPEPPKVETTPVRTQKLKPEVLPGVLRDRLEHEIASHERRFRQLPHGAPARRTCEGVIAVLKRCLEASDE